MVLVFLLTIIGSVVAYAVNDIVNLPFFFNEVAFFNEKNTTIILHIIISQKKKIILHIRNPSKIKS